MQLSMYKIPCVLKSCTGNFLSGLVSFSADLHSIISKLCAKYLFDEKDCLKGTYIHLPEYPLESPSNSLPAHVKSFVNLISICSLENHIAGYVTFQFDRQILRIYQPLQVLQKHLVFFRKFHFSSP